jgi:hypothetical protein
MTRDEAIVKALEMCLIGGNHLGAHKQDYWPAPDTNYQDAMEKLIHAYGMKEYDMWACWASIMRAAALVRGATVVDLSAKRAREADNGQAQTRR